MRNDIYSESVDDILNELMLEEAEDELGEESEKERINANKEAKKKIIKGIAIATLSLALLAAMIKACEKIDDTVTANKLKKVEAQCNRDIEIFKKYAERADKKGLTKLERNAVIELSKDNFKRNEQLKKLKTKVGKGLSEDQIKGFQKRQSEADMLISKIISGKIIGESTEVDYDAIVDVIIEKFNNDQIDANTCIALMEKAADRYLSDNSSDEPVYESDYNSIVDAICEKYDSDEIDMNTCVALIERAAAKYA